MTDKRRNASRSQVAAPKTQAPEKEQATKSVKTTTREERKKEPPKQVSKPVARRESKSSPSLAARIRSNRIGRFILEAFYELRYKVTWPTFIEARNMTIIVIILSAVIGGILAAADQGLYHLFSLMSGGK
jgi:preprotein translocase SecE subunit